jgi:hypothetical protein
MSSMAGMAAAKAGVSEMYVSGKIMALRKSKAKSENLKIKLIESGGSEMAYEIINESVMK